MTTPPLPHLPARAADSHKGTYGRALLVGGSRGMAGAIGLAGMSCLRGGAGLVKLAVPEVCQDTVASFEPSYMTVGLPCDDAGRITGAAKDALVDLIDAATAIAVGPGLGRSTKLSRLVAWLYRNVAKPMIFDADALNALSENRSLLMEPGGPRILTPHPGEFARLVGDNGTVSPTAADELAARCGIAVVLKGHRTHIADGVQSATNTTGNPGMATGGTGDVLTGLITALVCQGLSPFDAAHLGVHVHGRAGDLAAAELGQAGMIASDLVRHLPAAIREVSG